MLCAKFINDGIVEQDIIEEYIFSRFELMKDLRWNLYVEMAPLGWQPWWWWLPAGWALDSLHQPILGENLLIISNLMEILFCFNQYFTKVIAAKWTSNGLFKALSFTPGEELNYTSFFGWFKLWWKAIVETNLHRCDGKLPPDGRPCIDRDWVPCSLSLVEYYWILNI